MQPDDASSKERSAPSAAELGAASAGAETLIAAHVAAWLHPSPPKWLVRVNLCLLIVLTIFAMLWFSQHLEPYFTKMLIAGTSLTVWAVIRFCFDFGSKASKFDPWDKSRSLLGSLAFTRVLLAGALVLGLLWFTTSSLYFEREGAGTGAGESEYLVQVTQLPGKARFVDDVKIASSSTVFGAPYFWPHAKADLECRIVEPAGFEPFPCSIRAGKPTRVKVPGSFTAKQLQLLRIVPAGITFAELPEASDPAGTNYQLEMTVDGKTETLSDVRKQTIYVGAMGDDMELAMKLEKVPDYFDTVVKSLRAAQVAEDSAKQTASVLTLNARPWPVVQVKPGRKMSFLMRWTKTVDGQPRSGVMPGFPIDYTPTSEKVQTVWLPAL